MGLAAGSRVSSSRTHDGCSKAGRSIGPATSRAPRPWYQPMRYTFIVYGVRLLTYSSIVPSTGTLVSEA